MKNIDFGVIIYLLIALVAGGTKLYQWLKTDNRSLDSSSAKMNNNQKFKDHLGDTRDSLPKSLGDFDNILDVQDYMDGGVRRQSKSKFFKNKQKILNKEEPNIPSKKQTVVKNSSLEETIQTSVDTKSNLLIAEKIMNDKVMTMIAYEILSPPKALREE